MNICVLIKQVPVITNIQMNPQNLSLERLSTESMLNPADVNALEAALALKDIVGGEVTVFTMGNESSEVQIREALAMGANHAVRITDSAFSNADTLVTARVLAAAIRKNGEFDCIFCGENSLDSATGQIAGKLSALLSANLLTGVCQIDADDQSITAHKKAGDGYEVWKSAYPVVCSIVEGSNKPRMATIRGRMAAKKVEISILSNAELTLSEADLHSPSHVEAVFPAQKQAAGGRINGKDDKDSAAKLADILAENHFI